MFRGRYEHIIDNKGRVSVPARFREDLLQKDKKTFVVTTYDSCLIAYPLSEWLSLEKKISELPTFNKDTREFLRFFYSSATDCPVDKLGRILLPQTLRDFAGLKKDVMMVGALKHFEVWSKAGWDKAHKKSSPDDVGEMLSRLGL